MWTISIDRTRLNTSVCKYEHSSSALGGQPDKNLISTFALLDLILDMEMAGGHNRRASVPGYPQLSQYMGLLPQLGIFRSFSALGAKNILYLHAELVALEEELRQAEERDHGSGDELRVNYRRCWQFLKLSNCSGESRPQFRIVIDIRAVLKEYCKNTR